MKVVTSEMVRFLAFCVLSGGFSVISLRCESRAAPLWMGKSGLESLRRWRDMYVLFAPGLNELCQAFRCMLSFFQFLTDLGLVCMGAVYSITSSRPSLDARFPTIMRLYSGIAS